MYVEVPRVRQPVAGKVRRMYVWAGLWFGIGCVFALVVSAILRAKRKPKTFLMMRGFPMETTGHRQYRVKAETGEFWGFYYQDESVLGGNLLRWIWLSKNDVRIKEVVKD